MTPAEYEADREARIAILRERVAADLRHLEASAPPRGRLCRHCRKHPAGVGTRGLCWHHYRDRRVRERYPRQTDEMA